MRVVGEGGGVGEGQSWHSGHKLAFPPGSVPEREKSTSSFYVTITCSQDGQEGAELGSSLLHL